MWLLHEANSDKNNGTDETSRIEHIMPREHLTRKERMEFSNMIICCPGAIAGVAEKKTHCDRRKGERYVSFTPFDPQFIDSLSYHNDGTIVSSNEVWDKEINDILNLNADLLKMNRKEVKKSIIKTLGNRKWSKAEISALRKKFEAKDSKGQLIEYCGVAMWYLSKKIKIES